MNTFYKFALCSLLATFLILPMTRVQAASQFSSPRLSLQSPPSQDDCSTQLFTSSVNFLSSTLSESMLAHLPPTAQAYLRFLWAGYQNKFIDLAQLKKVAMSIVPLNPFREAAEKALEARLHMAIADKIANMTAQDWLAITNELQQHLPDLEKETVERNGATEDSSALIGLADPIETDLRLVDYQTASWFEYQGRVLLALDCDETGFCIYELDLTTGKPLELVKEIKAGRKYKTPSMYAHDGRLYLAAGTYGKGNEVCVFELDLLALKLNELDSRRARKDLSFNTPAWYEHAGRLYLVAGTRPSGFYFYEFSAGQLNKGRFYPTTGLLSEPFAWQVYKGNAYLAVHTQVDTLHAYKLGAAGQLISLGKNLSSRTNAPEWLIRNDRLYLAAGLTGVNLKIYVLSLNNDEFDDLAQAPVDVSGVAEVLWFRHKGRQLMVLQSTAGLHLFELVNDQLIERDSFHAPGLIGGRLSWVEYGERLFLAVASLEPQLYLLEFNVDTSRLVKLSSWEAEMAIGQPLIFYKRDDQLYLEAIDEGGHLYHFSLVQKIEGLGR